MRDVYRCGLYLPGHQVHWIQAKLAVRGEPDPRTGAKRERVAGHVEVFPDGLLIVEVAGSIRRLWHHDPDRLAALVAPNDGAILHQPGWGLLLTKSEQGHYLFCVADADSPELRPCPSERPSGTPIDLLREAGGFSLRGPAIREWLESRREQ